MIYPSPYIDVFVVLLGDLTTDSFRFLPVHDFQSEGYLISLSSLHVYAMHPSVKILGGPFNWNSEQDKRL